MTSGGEADSAILAMPTAPPPLPMLPALPAPDGSLILATLALTEIVRAQPLPQRGMALVNVRLRHIHPRNGRFLLTLLSRPKRD